MTVSDNMCETVSIITLQKDYVIPDNDATGATEVCDVVVSRASGSEISTAGVTYDISYLSE